jgi:hypothetical protein
MAANTIPDWVIEIGCLVAVLLCGRGLIWITECALRWRESRKLGG